MKHELSDKPPARYQGSAPTVAGSNVEQVPVADDGVNNMKFPLWLQVIASISIPVILALLALVALMNPQFAELRGLAIENRDAIVALDSRLTGEISRLDNRITVEVTRLDNKFDALANLMIVAHTNGGATEAELVAIWESILAAE